MKAVAVLNDPQFWQVAAGLMFTAFAFTMAWRYVKQRRWRRR